MGRPSNRGGIDQIEVLLSDREVLVVGENDRKVEDGKERWPGRDGAQHVARQLARRWDTPVRWALPPSGFKDVRDSLVRNNLDVTAADAVKAAGQELLQGLMEQSVAERPRGARASGDPGGCPYRETAAGLIWSKTLNDGPIDVSLTNFTARIVAEVEHDDGAEVRREFEIEATLGGRTHRFEIPTSQFSNLGWVIEHLGAKALVYPGQSLKDHTRAAIQLLSTDVAHSTIYAHTGWRKIGGEWVYLHAGGAIGAHGPLTGIEVSLSNDLDALALPAPADRPETQRAVRESMGLLRLAPHAVSIPLFGAVWRVLLGACDFSIHLVGATGSGKTELATLAQQHFGSSVTARSLPGSWASTANALEAQAFMLKDMLFVVDDFAPDGSGFDVQRYHREAARLLRAQGNRSARHRMRADASLRPSKPPRGLIVSTGEDVPRGQSIRARMLVLELGPGDLDWSALTACQQVATQGAFATVTAAFVQWLAARYEDLQRDLKGSLRTLREKARGSDEHRRTAEIVANLMLGWHTFVEFARELDAIPAAEADSLLGAAWEALGRAAHEQAMHQAASDPVNRFVELLGSAIASGQAHVAGSDGGTPVDSERWGWRERPVGGTYDPQPEGARVGWIDGEDLYLDAEAAYCAARSMAGAGGDGIAVSSRTLWKRLQERDLLLTSEPKRFTVRKVLEGARRSVLHLRAGLIVSSVRQVDQVDHEPPSRGQEGGSVAHSMAHSDRPSAPPSAPSNGPADPKATVGGAVGALGALSGATEDEIEVEI